MRLLISLTLFSASVWNHSVRLLQRFRQREKIISDKAGEEVGEASKTENVDGGRIVQGQWIGPIQIDGDDVEYLMEVWRNRCAVTGDRLGTVLELTRWDMGQPSTCNNIVLMGATALQRYDKDGKATIPEEVQAKIETRLQSCRPDAKA